MKKNGIIIKWLNKEFGNLTEVVKGDKIFYVDKDGLPLFMYYQDEKNDCVYVNYDRIWQLLQSIFGIKYEQIQDILRIWLEETYNFKRCEPLWTKQKTILYSWRNIN